MDFWGINLYTRDLVDARRPFHSAKRFSHKMLRMIDQDFYLEEMYPEGMTAMLEFFGDRPVYVTENGCSCDDDRFRIVYLALYLSAVRDAIQHGVDIRGYLYWSLMDNFKWGSYMPRFGLLDVFQKSGKTIPLPVAQVEASAKYLQHFFFQRLGLKIDVKQIVVYPGWFMDWTREGTIPHAPV